ncbi:MAG TPA: amidohydrolase family protein, partial [Burkholderiaceae bacterium]
NFDVDQRWCLVHATHMTEAETIALAQSGAIAGICPSTEANLGDGIFNGLQYAQAGGAWGIGSDSHVCVDMLEELRLYEYSQRLLHRKRNVLAGDNASDAGGHVGAYLYNQALRGGALASGRATNGLMVGQCADFIVLDAAHPDLHGKRGNTLLDSLVFSRHGNSPIQHVVCRGKRVVQNGRHDIDQRSAHEYRDALAQLQDN